MKRLAFIILIFCTLKVAARTITVLEIDSGIQKYSHQEIDQHLPKTTFDSLDYFDPIDHGTFIAGLIIKGTCKEVELQSCSYFEPQGKANVDLYLNCLKTAINIKPDLVNISGGGTDFIKEEFNFLTILSNLGTKIIVAAGNNGKDLSKEENNYYPAKHKIANLIPVGNIEETGERHLSSNYGLLNEIYEVGVNSYSTLPNGDYGFKTGTSMSAAKKTNQIIIEMCQKLK